MDLPILTRVSGFVLHEYNATRFRWRFRDGGACFEAFHSSDPLEYDGYGAYCPLMVAYVPDGSMGTMSWAHIYRVRMNRGTGILFTTPILETALGISCAFSASLATLAEIPGARENSWTTCNLPRSMFPHIGARIGFAQPWIFPLYIGRAWRNRTRSTGVDGDRTRPVGISPRQITVRHCVGLGGR